MDQQLEPLVATTAPDLLAVKGISTVTAATLLSTPAITRTGCGVRRPSPICAGWLPSRPPRARSPATGLNRGGDRAANQALYLLAIRRLGWHGPTQAYLARRTAEGLSKPEIVRCLKRYLARELYPLLARNPALRPASAPSSVLLLPA